MKSFKAKRAEMIEAGLRHNFEPTLAASKARSAALEKKKVPVKHEEEEKLHKLTNPTPGSNKTIFTGKGGYKKFH